MKKMSSQRIMYWNPLERAYVVPDRERQSKGTHIYILYAYQGLNDLAKDAKPVQDHLSASIHQGATNLVSDEHLEDKIKPLHPRAQKLIRT